jgi:hypothetical protein
VAVAENVALVKERIERALERAGRKPGDVRIVAVTKTATVETARELLQNGITHLGENRSNEFLHKYAAIGKEAVWHFIGTLQSRKVKDIIDYADYIHSLDRLSLAREIDKRAKRPVPCFVQVNISKESTKHGILEEETLPFIEKLAQYPNIKVEGLMTIAPYTEDRGLIRSVFRRLKKLQETVQRQSYPFAPCKELSMGMSNDFEIAVEEGATFVRIGTLLVGENKGVRR